VKALVAERLFQVRVPGRLLRVRFDLLATPLDFLAEPSPTVLSASVLTTM